LAFYLTLPASVGLAVIAQPVIQLIYEHGTFNAASTSQTALALQAYTIGLAGYSGIKILVPCFYAMQRRDLNLARGKVSGPRFPFRDERRPFHSGASQPHRHRAESHSLFCALTIISISAMSAGARHGFGGRSEFPPAHLRHQKKIDLVSPGEWLSFFARVMLATFACGCIVLFGMRCSLHIARLISLLGAAILFFNIAGPGPFISA